MTGTPLNYTRDMLKGMHPATVERLRAEGRLDHLLTADEPKTPPELRGLTPDEIVARLRSGNLDHLLNGHPDPAGGHPDPGATPSVRVVERSTPAGEHPPQGDDTPDPGEQ